jgi:hypothetical protein
MVLHAFCHKQAATYAESALYALVMIGLISIYKPISASKPQVGSHSRARACKKTHIPNTRSMPVSVPMHEHMYNPPVHETTWQSDPTPNLSPKR